MKPFFFKAVFYTVLFAVMSVAVFPLSIQASSTDGTIDPINYLAKFRDEGSRINFGYFTNDHTLDVHITDSALTGYLWSENFGWISLNCSNTNSCGTNSFSVSNDGSGHLSGYAWGENVGWINFRSTVGNADHAVNIIYTNSSNAYPSEFSGHAWSENYGWIQFSCAVAEACVRTDWVESSRRSGGVIPGNPATPINVPPVTPPVVPTIPPVTPPVTPPAIPANPPVTPPGTPPGTTPSVTPTGTTPTVPGVNTTSWFPIPGFIPSFPGLDILRTPVGDAVAKTIATAGIATAAAISIVSALFVNPVSISEIVLIPFRLWSLLLAAFGLKKRTRPWGTVYDSVTKQPLDPAYVVLKDISGNEVATSITDLDGRYAFLVQPGVYTLVANKTNYTFPSQKMAGKERDEIYGDLYLGGQITIANEEAVIVKNIPMDPTNFDWNEFAKQDRSIFKFYAKRDITIARIANIFFVVGFVVATLALIAAPKPYNMVIFGLYVVLLVLRKTGLKPLPLGSIMEGATGYPLSYAVIHVYSASTKTEITKRIADARGRYHCLIAKGTYYVSIEKKNADETYTMVHTSEPFEVKNGVLNKTFTA